MNLATIIAILGAVSTLLSIAKDAPAVVDEAKSLLAKVEPHVTAATDDVKRQFADAGAAIKAL